MIQVQSKTLLQPHRHGLTFHKKNKNLVLNSYLPYIIKEVGYEEIYNLHDMWNGDQKHMILKDLERFLMRKDYYRK
uniref:Uncharacterized protein n=1 Tax=Solanum lycopersicum TaxID=4081 RepID=A0A3Q7FIN4_SOLLC